jgi:hypothetical protein
MICIVVLLSVKFGNMIVKVPNKEAHLDDEIDFHLA